jgi:transposase
LLERYQTLAPAAFFEKLRQVLQQMFNQTLPTGSTAALGNYLKRHGQVIVLYLFTTLQLPVEQIIELYGRRWNIETDLRSLKKEVRLRELRSKSPQMIAKEVIACVMAYNLIRTVQLAAAELVGIEPRQLSFSRVQAVKMLRCPCS